MSWWGKVIGGAFGFVLGGSLGALLGTVLGHGVDKRLTLDSFRDAGLSEEEWADEEWEAGEQERVQAAFFTATFSIMGHIAKADGRVSESEISLAKNTMARMQLDEQQIKVAMELFTQGKQADFPLLEVISQFKKECHRRTSLIRIFLEIQIATALADGELHPKEQGVLIQLADLLGFSGRQFEKLLAMVVAQQRFASGAWRQSQEPSSVAQDKQTLRQAYDVLGLDSDVSDTDLKKAYRRLMSQHHPDKLVSKGLPEEMMKIATEKTQEIKSAYELIKKSRNH